MSPVGVMLTGRSERRVPNAVLFQAELHSETIEKLSLAAISRTISNDESSLNNLRAMFMPRARRRTTSNICGLCRGEQPAGAISLNRNILVSPSSDPSRRSRG
jgi:hypothetical protein